jgi:small GTP-binding protein
MNYRPSSGGSLEIWDTAGQEQYRAMLPLYFRRASAAVVIFDLTDPHSLAAVPAWVEQVRKSAPAGVMLVLVGTKCDLPPVVTVEQAWEQVSLHGMAGYWETSGWTGQGVEAPFQDIIKHASDLPPAQPAYVGFHEPSSGSSCC